MKFNDIIFSQHPFSEKHSAWIEHSPFAFFLIEKLQPKVFVELGTHYGVSYFAFCQAINQLKYNTKAYAVDTFTGDEHAGFYGEEVFNYVSKINNENFSGFSNLMRGTFDEVNTYFENGTIDLLHIDGLHTYEAVKHDFEFWLPKMSEKGIVIFHDTVVKEHGFGVWKLMDELGKRFPYFEFEHGYGLGILCTGNKVNPEFLEFVRNAGTNSFMLKLFENIGKKIWLEQQQKLQQEKLKQQNEIIESNNQTISLKDNVNIKLRQTITSNEQQIKNLLAQAKVLEQMVVDKDVEINNLYENVNILNQQTQNLQENIDRLIFRRNELETQLAKLKQELSQKENGIINYQNQISNLKSIHLKQEQDIQQLNLIIDQITKSASWKLTAPLRFVKRKVRTNYFFLLPKISLIQKSGLFDKDYYLENNPDVKESKMNPAQHYLVFGGLEGRKPSKFFDSSLYFEQNADVKATGMNPLLHYLLFGIREGRKPLLNQREYPDSVKKIPDKRKLIHLLKLIKKQFFSSRAINLVSKSEYFDRHYYLRVNVDVKDKGIDPAKHYLFHGWKEGRDPSADFDNQFYLTEYPDVRNQNINPLLHFVKYGQAEGRKTIRTIFTENIERIGNKHTHDYEQPDPTLLLSTKLPVKLIAFYLPQFHPIPENDAWWGKGFTEWTNVTRAKPYFEGHNQPNLPTDLGFYDLRIPDVMQQQIEMAKSFGIQAFCFHYYWFAGKRLLEKPLDMFLEHKEWDFAYCICWANENWTRRWDGFDHEILMAQEHSPEDDIAFLEDATKYLLDSRYIRVDNKPLLVIYRPQLFQNMNETADHWRKHFKQKHNLELFIAMAQTFGKYDPREFGLNAAIEFPPHNLAAKKLHDKYKTTDFKGNIYSALTFSENKENKIKNSPFNLFRGLMLNWDNTPRKGIFGNIYLQNTPANYGKWLREAIEDTSENKQSENEKLIFINAWNEWAEGTHLEPNQKYGYAYLNETKRVLNKASKSKLALPANGKIIFVSHDAYFSGAQLILLNIIQWIANYTSIECKVVLLADGELTKSFAIYAEIFVLETNENNSTVRNQLSKIINGDESLIYLNSVASGKVIDALKTLNIPIITHFHELKESVRHYAGKYFNNVLQSTNHFIACSKAVEDYLISYNAPSSKISLIHEFIQQQPLVTLSEDVRIRLKIDLGLPADKKIIVSSGLGLFWRKGADLFIDVCDAYSKLSVKDDYFFLWVGGDFATDNNKKYGNWTDQLKRIEDLQLTDKIRFTGKVSNVKDYLKVSEIFLLTSREDPFPLVCLEAANNHLPIICFADSGGMSEFVQEDAGFVVPFEDIKKMAGVTLYLMRDDEERVKLGSNAYQRFIKNHTVETTLPKILNTIRSIGRINPLVSVIVPNYNYAHFLDERLSSIYNQTFQDFEVIILDDASTDESIEIIKKYCLKPNTTVITNDVNSGSVLRQWRKGIENAKGKFVWIAEADDYCEIGFLEKILQKFTDNTIVLAYCNSNSVNENGKISENFYLNCGYYEGLGYPDSRWKQDYFNNGLNEIQNVLAIKNTIPNCSAVVFRKEEFLKIDFSEFNKFTFGHDWLTYINLLMNGSVAYISETLNYHRRHPHSVISESVKNAHLTISEYHEIHRWIVNKIDISEEVRLLIKMFITNSLLKNWKAIDLDEKDKSFELYRLK